MMTRVTRAPVTTVRLERGRAGWRYASAALHRRPDRCVTCVRPTPSLTSPLMSALGAMPKATADPVPGRGAPREVFGATEVRQDARVTPAVTGRGGPAVVVERVTTDPHL